MNTSSTTTLFSFHGALPRAAVRSDHQARKNTGTRGLRVHALSADGACPHPLERSHPHGPQALKHTGSR